MTSKALEITTKLLLEKPVSEEDKQYLVSRNAKYELVRYLVIEHGRLNGKSTLINFHFTPGDNFDELSTFDLVNAIVNLEQSKAKPIRFGDKRLKNQKVATYEVQNTCRAVSI